MHLDIPKLHIFAYIQLNPLKICIFAKFIFLFWRQDFQDYGV